MEMLRRRIWIMRMFMLFIIVTPFVSMAVIRTPVYASSTVLSVYPTEMIDETKTPGESFTIEIHIADVTDLWGYLLYLSYDTSVLTATSYASNPIHYLAEPSWINDTAGYVTMSYHMAFGTPAGFTGSMPGTVPFPLATITFTVDDYGWSPLDLHDTVLSDHVGGSIDHDVADGYFANLLVMHTLTVSSSPISGIEFTVDGTDHTTPWSHSLPEETYTVAMPSTWTVDTDVYNFDHWEDSSTDPTRVVSLTSDVSITAYYELAPKYWILTVNSDPIAGVEFTLDGVSQTTPYSASLIEGSHTVVMPSSWTEGTDVYNFDHWEDMSTDPTRAISLTTHMSMIAYWKRLPKLSIKLSGELDYLFMEDVKIQLAALVKDSTTGEPISNANVTIKIYGPDRNLWVSDVMVERLAGTGIYEWESEETIRQLRLKKGVYLVHLSASYQGGSTASDILEFHIDPPAEQALSPPIYYYVLTFFAILVIVLGLVFLKKPIHNRFRRLVQCAHIRCA